MKYDKCAKYLSLVMLLGFSVAVQTANAREPGIAPVMPPGLTLGLPIALNPPPGFYLMNRSAYASYTLRDNNGNYNGQKSQILSDSLQLNWVPGWQLAGASYKAFVMLPVIDLKMTRTTTATGKLGAWHSTGLGNPKLQPLDLSWMLGNGWAVGGGIGFYAPLGQYSKGADLNIAGHFWTLEPSFGVTYLKNGWHASMHVVYNTNTRNDDNQYKSGDQAFVNLTTTKAFGAWSVGPVAYYQKQVTKDSNKGGLPTYGGRIFDAPMQFGAGLIVNTEIDKLRLYAMVTRDVVVHNTAGGNKIWFNVLLPL